MPKWTMRKKCWDTSVWPVCPVSRSQSASSPRRIRKNCIGRCMLSQYQLTRIKVQKYKDISWKSLVIRTSGYAMFNPMLGNFALKAPLLGASVRAKSHRFSRPTEWAQWSRDLRKMFKALNEISLEMKDFPEFWSPNRLRRGVFSTIPAITALRNNSTR